MMLIYDQVAAGRSVRDVGPCMGYVNTLLIQEILAEPAWQNILTPEDKRALNVLFHSHINPYGLFPLDLKTRLGITLEPVSEAEIEGEVAA
jgi:hypothetical protein